MRNARDWFTFQKKYFSKETTSLDHRSRMVNVIPIGTQKLSVSAVNLLPITSAMLAKDCSKKN